MELIAPYRAGIHAAERLRARIPDRLGVGYPNYGDLQPANFPNRSLVELPVRPDGRIPIRREHNLFGRPVKEIRARLPSQLPHPRTVMPMVRVLAVRDPSLNRLVPNNSRLMLVALIHIATENA